MDSPLALGHDRRMAVTKLETLIGDLESSLVSKRAELWEALRASTPDQRDDARDSIDGCVEALDHLRDALLRLRKDVGTAGREQSAWGTDSPA